MRGKFLDRSRKSISKRLRAKLSFDQGYAEHPVYTIKGFTNEKGKGIDMIELIKSNFNISKDDIDEHIKNMREEMTEWHRQVESISIEHSKTKIKWTRDNDGKIISPYSKKAMELKKEEG